MAQRKDSHGQNKGRHIISVLTEIEKDLARAADAILNISKVESIKASFIPAHFSLSAAVSIFNLNDSMNACVRQGKHAYVNLKQGVTLCLIMNIRQRKWV